MYRDKLSVKYHYVKLYDTAGLYYAACHYTLIYLSYSDMSVLCCLSCDLLFWLHNGIYFILFNFNVSVEPCLLKSLFHFADVRVIHSHCDDHKEEQISTTASNPQDFLQLSSVQGGDG